jgi:magnesium-transporting ATPase (P-type)
MDAELNEKLSSLEKKVEETRVMATRTYKIILWTAIATAVTFLLPLIALAFVIPFFLKTISSISGL